MPPPGMDGALLDNVLAQRADKDNTHG